MSEQTASEPGRGISSIMWVSSVSLLLLLILHTFFHPVVEFDTRRLIVGIPALWECMSQGTLCSEVSYFPPLQQLPALVLYLAHVPVDALGIYLLWIGLTFSASLVGWMLWLCGRGGGSPKYPHPGWIALVLLSGPMLAYYGTTFSESIVTAAVCGLLFAVIGQKLLFVFLLALIVTLSKDTAAPLIGCYLAACCLLAPGANKKIFGIGLAGIAVGSAVAIWFNYLRYDAPINAFHLSPVFQADSIDQITRNLVAMLISPNGGLLFFFTVIIILVASGFFRAAPQLSRPERMALFLGLLTLLLHCVGTSIFYSPFGWIAWGNRLGLPWFCGVFLLTICAIDRHSDMEGFPSSTKIYLVLGAAVLNLPHLLATVDRKAIFSVFIPNDACPKLADVLADKAYYFKCLNSYLWPDSSVLIDAFSVAEPGFLGVLLTAAGTLCTTTALWSVVSTKRST